MEANEEEARSEQERGEKRPLQGEEGKEERVVTASSL